MDWIYVNRHILDNQVPRQAEYTACFFDGHCELPDGFYDLDSSGLNDCQNFFDRLYYWDYADLPNYQDAACCVFSQTLFS